MATIFQTSYDDAPAIGRPGQLADGQGGDVIACIATVDMYFGRFVADAGLAADGVTQLARPMAADAGTDKILGVVLHSHTIENQYKDNVNPPTIPAGTPFNVLRKGRIYVSCDGAFDPASDTAFVRFTANGSTKLPGMLTNSADSGKADELNASGYLVQNRILRKITAAGVMPVEINLPS